MAELENPWNVARLHDVWFNFAMPNDKENGSLLLAFENSWV
jgi:hypothetical protein